MQEDINRSNYILQLQTIGNNLATEIVLALIVREFSKPLTIDEGDKRIADRLERITTGDVEAFANALQSDLPLNDKAIVAEHAMNSLSRIRHMVSLSS